MPIQLKNATPPASNQDAFNRVWQHFIVEGNLRCAAQQGGSEVCVYRSSGGNGCAVGCMLPDDKAAICDEFKSVITHYEIWGACKDWFAHVDQGFLVVLQQWHDCGNNLPDKNGLRSIGESHGLTIPPC